jgi:ureidoacrylate peracid hydrolase
MHKVELNPSVVESTVARRGRRHVFSDLEAERTASLVVDLQRAYLDEELNNSFCRHALDIVPNVNRIANALPGPEVSWFGSRIRRARRRLRVGRPTMGES